MLNRSVLGSIQSIFSGQQLRRFGQKQKSKNVRRFFIPISAVAALGYICYRQYYRIIEREERKAGIYREKEIIPFGPWKTKVYVSFPRRIQSRIWGYFHNLTLPVWSREFIIGLFVKNFDCDLSEAAESDLKKYKNLDEFFRRPLKPNIRPVSSDCLVSPADGCVDRVGQIVNGQIEQVKGITYDISAFLGDDLAIKYTFSKPLRKLCYCVIYLAPGDYHGFHSPVDWQITFRRHFSGHLLGVSQKVTTRVAHLFCINERVLLMGTWSYGFFSMTPVGATNVGKIAIDFETSLRTNMRRRLKDLGRRIPEFNDLQYPAPFEKNRGDRIGEFRFGSSVVLVFEAPLDFQFTVDNGTKIKYGQTIGRVPTDSDQQPSEK